MTAIEKCTAAFIETTVDDEIVIVSLDEGQFFSLRDTGLAIWNLIDGTRSKADILLELSARFDAPIAVLEQDLDQFLEEIGAAGFTASGKKA